MKYLKLILLVLVLTIAFASSNYRIANANPNSVCALNWHEVVLPQPEDGQVAFHDVAGVSANDVWALGIHKTDSAARMLIEHWDGSTWSIVPSPDVSIYPYGSGTLLAFASNDVWASVLGGEHPYLLKWDGSAWNLAELPDVENLSIFSMDGNSADNVWISGWTDGNAYVARWDGTQWTDMTPPTVAPADTMRQVLSRADNEVYLFGIVDTDRNTTPPPTFVEYFMLKWDGTNWTEHSTFRHGYNPLYYVPVVGTFSVVADDNIWIPGYADLQGSKYKAALLWHWDGNTWSFGHVMPYDDFNSVLYSISNVGAMGVWILGSQERFFPSSFVPILSWLDGTNWNALSVHAFPDYSKFNALAVVSDKDIWAVGSIAQAGTWVTRGFVWHANGCATPPDAPKLRAPEDKAVIKKLKPTLTWKEKAGTLYSEIDVREVRRNQPLLTAKARDGKYKFDRAVSPANNYFWRVRGCNAAGCGVWSGWRKFWVKERYREPLGPS
jgi:hypothetical protein